MKPLLMPLPTLLASEVSLFGLLTWTKDRWLSKNPPGFQNQMGTSEISSLMKYASTGFSASPV